ncbi:MAG: hypothetical protein Q4A07_10440 [Coriobacteriales bacterium]|nr:hypothetical protein [Coriobacteriales bacterium]
MNNATVLLKTLLLSTSQRNIRKHTADKSKRRRVVGNTIGMVVLHLMLAAYCIVTCVGYGTFGLIDAAPILCALVISLLAFVFTLFKTNGYLFNFREYDMLMSLPFETRTVAACKFLYMYVTSLPWYLNLSLSVMVGYGIYAHPSVIVYPVWLLLSLLLPIIPMLGAAFIGFLFARVSSGFKKTNLVQTVLTFVFVLLCFGSRFFLEDMFSNNKVQATLEQVSAATDQAASVYLPADWFARAITAGSVLDALLLVAVSVALFAAVFRVVGRSYRRINSALKSHAASGKYSVAAQKQRSVVVSIAFKEFKRMTSSTTYMVNGAMGELLAVILGVVTLFVGFDNIVAAATHGAPFDAAILQPAIPFIVYFLIGMVATTACSPSLEGKNFWILQSLPIQMKTVYQGKMLFNMCLTVPFMAIATLCLCVSAGVPVVNTALYLLLGLVLCAFSTAWGCVCGIRHMRLDWENEVEVIKQGAAVAIYMLPNMFVVMGLCVAVVFLGTWMDHCLLTLVFTLIAAALAALSYLRALRLAERG